VRAALGRINGAANAGAFMQARLNGQLEAALTAAGPDGWLDWTPTSEICSSIVADESNWASYCQSSLFY